MTITTGVVMHRRSLLVVALALTACRGPSSVSGTPSASATGSVAVSPNAHDHVVPANGAPLPLKELANARGATARYHDFQRALRDGYVDIGVVLPNMGRHLLNEALLDATFDAERPEVLVYMEDLGGRMKLVAVEYAVPLNLTVTPPDGFPGAADVWFADDRFQLWTLHAWVFRENPDGIFNPTNRRVP
jgi:hypothetical protein